MKRANSDRGFSLVEVLVAVVVLGLAGVSVLGAAAAAARGSGTHRDVANAQAVVVAAAADAIMGARPQPCLQAQAAYQEAVAARLDALDLGGAWSPADVTVSRVQEWDVVNGEFKLVCENNVPELVTPQLVTIDVVSPSGGVVRSLQAMTDALPPVVDIGNPLVWANSPFAVVTSNDVTLTSLNVWGGAAVGGQLRFTDGLVGHVNGGVFTVPGEPVVTSLLVDDRIVITAGSGELYVNKGWVHVGSGDGLTIDQQSNLLYLRSTTSPTDAVKVQGDAQPADGVVRQNLYDFVGAFEAFRNASASMAALPAQCLDAEAAALTDVHGRVPQAGGDVWFRLQRDKVNVLSITTADLARPDNINNGSVQPSYNTPLIINVTDPGAVSLDRGRITQGWSPHVIWNFPNATSLTITDVVGGSVYAPNADVVFGELNKPPADIRGAVIAKSLSADPTSPHSEVKWADAANTPDMRPINCERER